MLFSLARTLRFSILGTAVAASMFIGPQAQAGFTALGSSNWQAEWDTSLDPFVSINFVAIVGDAIHIQKSAQFTQGPNGQGLYPTIPIVFRQVGASSIMHIVIDDEIITNQTGTTWTDFHMDLLDSGNAAFNPAMTLASNPNSGSPIGFSIAPFTQAAFTPDNLHLDISGGQLLNGQSWFPGDGASDGELWIDVVSNWNGQFGTVFTLKETPTPTPGALALLGLAAFAGRSRRRG